jgi:23S rRNA-/tRNA-specific pseudouridylate synthase
MDESCYVLPNGEKLFLLNRLDSPTSGIVLLTPLAEVARRIRNLWRCRVVRKHYVALVKGKIVLPCTWRDKLQIARGIHVRARPGTLGDLTALTDIEPDRIVVWRGEVFSYVQLFPRTGRTHQLRFQCSQHRHPIVGDRSYGDFSLNRRIDAQHLYLHAQGLTIPLDGREYSFEDPVPWSKELRCVGTKQ